MQVCVCIVLALSRRVTGGGGATDDSAADVSATDRLIDQLDGPAEDIAEAADAAERMAGDLDMGDLGLDD
jgi:hypothetical protein